MNWTPIIFIPQVINSIVSTSVDEHHPQPEQAQVKSSLLLFPGTVVVYRGFRQAAPRELRNITVAEFKAVAEALAPNYGSVVSIRLRRQSKDSVMFIKRRPNAIQHFDTELCSLEQYTLKYDCASHPTVTENVKTTLIRQGHLPAGHFS